MTVTWDPSNKHADITLSNGNMTAANTGTQATRSVIATDGRSTGKYYFEVYWSAVSDLTHLYVGVGPVNMALNHYVGDTVAEWSYRADGAYYNDTPAYGNPSWKNGDVVIQVLVDLDNHKIWFGKDNVIDGDPVAGTGAAFTNLSGTLYPILTILNNGVNATARFAAGDLTYSPPSGFEAWDTHTTSVVSGPFEGAGNFTASGQSNEVIVGAFEGTGDFVASGYQSSIPVGDFEGAGNFVAGFSRSVLSESFEGSGNFVASGYQSSVSAGPFNAVGDFVSSFGQGIVIGDFDGAGDFVSSFRQGIVIGDFEGAGDFTTTVYQSVHGVQGATELQYRLVTIVTTDGETIKISDYTESGYVEIIHDWDDVTGTVLDPTTFDTTPATAAFLVLNNVEIETYDRFSKIPGLVFGSIVITHNGVEIFNGTIDDVPDVGNGLCKVNCIGIDSELSKEFVYEIVTDTDYPDADPDDVGLMLPQVWGTPKRVRFSAIDVGVLTTLATTIATVDSVADIELSSTIALPSTGSVQIGAEKISYTSKNDTTKTLSGITRATAGTDATIHYAGVLVGEVRSAYTYGLGSPASVIGDVYIKDVLQDPTQYTTYTGIGGDDHTTYPGRAIIEFSDLSILKMGGGDLTGSIANYQIERPVGGLPIGHITAIDNHGVVAGFNDTTTVTFPAEPAGDLTEIYVDYYFEWEHFDWSGSTDWNAWEDTYEYIDSNWFPGGFHFYIDDERVVSFENRGPGYLASQYYSFSSSNSPIRVKYDSWPTSAEISKAVHRIDIGTYFLKLVHAVVGCTSTVSETDQWGKQVSRKAIGLPIGKMLTNSTIDDAEVITFPEAPSGNLNGIYIKFSFDFNIVGAYWESNNDPGGHEFPVRDKPKNLYIGDYIVSHLADDDNYGGGLDGGSETSTFQSALYVGFSSWQTSIAKTKSILARWGVAEEFVITDAEQFCFTDDFSNDLALSGNSVADSIIGADIFADVTTPLTLPTDIMQNLIEVKCGKTDACDVPSYRLAEISHTNDSYEEAVVLDEIPNVRETLASIALQARAIQYFWLNKHYVKYMAGSYSVDAVITADDIYQRNAKFYKTNKAYIVNDITSKYNKYWWDSSDFQNTVTTDDSGSKVTYGVQSKSFEYPFIQGETQAQAVIDWRLLDFKLPRTGVEYIGTQNRNLYRRIGEIITFDTTDTDLYALLADEVEPTDKFLILNVIFQPDGKIKIVTIGVE